MNDHNLIIEKPKNSEMLRHMEQSGQLHPYMHDLVRSLTLTNHLSQAPEQFYAGTLYEIRDFLYALIRNKHYRGSLQFLSLVAANLHVDGRHAAAGFRAQFEIELTSGSHKQLTINDITAAFSYFKKKYRSQLKNIYDLYAGLGNIAIQLATGTPQSIRQHFILVAIPYFLNTRNKASALSVINQALLNISDSPLTEDIVRQELLSLSPYFTSQPVFEKHFKKSINAQIKQLWVTRQLDSDLGNPQYELSRFKDNPPGNIENIYTLLFKEFGSKLSDLPPYLNGFDLNLFNYVPSESYLESLILRGFYRFLVQEKHFEEAYQLASLICVKQAFYNFGYPSDDEKTYAGYVIRQGDEAQFPQGHYAIRFKSLERFTLQLHKTFGGNYLIAPKDADATTNTFFRAALDYYLDNEKSIHAGSVIREAFKNFMNAPTIPLNLRQSLRNLFPQLGELSSDFHQSFNRLLESLPDQTAYMKLNHLTSISEQTFRVKESIPFSPPSAPI